MNLKLSLFCLASLTATSFAGTPAPVLETQPPVEHIYRS
ncbi:MAG: hypothetical protein JWO94_1245, partial [Verrucomicrobiaceae bacterium]|nr:hypothetical protein [Verrucomicrobiaceae bacterium]